MLMIYLSMIDTEEDKDIFKILHDEYSTIMYKRAYAILKDKALAEDVVQESFIRILKNFDKIGKKKCPQTRKYFVSIVRTISIDVYMKTKKQQAISFDTIEGAIIDEFANTEDIFEGKEIEHFLLQLPESYYIILSLKYGDGYSYKEIASILDLTKEEEMEISKQMVSYVFNKGIYNGFWNDGQYSYSITAEVSFEEFVKIIQRILNK